MMQTYIATMHASLFFRLDQNVCSRYFRTAFIGVARLHCQYNIDLNFGSMIPVRLFLWIERHFRSEKRSLQEFVRLKKLTGRTGEAKRAPNRFTYRTDYVEKYTEYKVI